MGLDIYEFNLLDLPVNGGLRLTNSQTFENGVFFDSVDHLSGANGIKTFSLRHIISLAVSPKASLVNSGQGQELYSQPVIFFGSNEWAK
jgi:hypothetical protein